MIILSSVFIPNFIPIKWSAAANISHGNKNVLLGFTGLSTFRSNGSQNYHFQRDSVVGRPPDTKFELFQEEWVGLEYLFGLQKMYKIKHHYHI